MTRKLTVKKSEGIKPIPGGDVYPAKLTEIRDGEGNFGEYYKFIFEITDESTYEGEQRTLLASRKLSRSPKGASKLLDILEALKGNKLQLEEEVDIDDFIGKKCRILVEEAKERDGIMIQNIAKVLPNKQ
jgi:hypothetical protein